MTTSVTNSSSLYSYSSTTASSVKTSHKRKEPEQTVSEFEGTRLNAVIESLPGKFYGLKGITDIIVIYDDPYEDIVKILQQEKEIPETFRRIANQVTKLNLRCLESIIPNLTEKVCVQT